jgi:hypothetical protein
VVGFAGIGCVTCADAAETGIASATPARANNLKYFNNFYPTDDVNAVSI